jgi:dUTP pyrophosphatase
MHSTKHVEVKFMTQYPTAMVPRYETEGAAGMDIHAYLPEPVVIAPGHRENIPTGLVAEIPVGYEGQVRPRSGLALRYGLTVLNAPGTIDSDYRGELCVLLINQGLEPVTIHDGDRIAQLVIAPVCHVQISQVKEVTLTERNTGGFGSTGI